MKKHKSSQKENGYAASRYNSLNHGVLSRLKILPWEDAQELEDVQQSFLNDHQPKGATEKYLVLELANIAFRRSRLYQAENALACQKLEHLSGYSFNFVAKTATLLSKEDCQNETYKNNDTLAHTIFHDREDDCDSIAYLEEQIELIQHLIQSDSPYEQMLQKLSSDFVEAWQNHERKYDNKKGGLVLFLQETIIEFCQNRIDSIKARPYVKQHAVACSYIPDDKTETLQRYETALDRRFERILGMLLKLQSVRQERMTLVPSVISN